MASEHFSKRLQALLLFTIEHKTSVILRYSALVKSKLI